MISKWTTRITRSSSTISPYNNDNNNSNSSNEAILNFTNAATSRFYSSMTKDAHNRVLLDSEPTSMGVNANSENFLQYRLRLLSMPENAFLITATSIISLLILSVLAFILLTYHRHQQYQDRAHAEAYLQKRKRYKRQSSRFSIDLDRFVADISGFDDNEIKNAEGNAIRIPNSPPPLPSSSPPPLCGDEHKTQLNPLAVSIAKLVAKSLSQKEQQQLSK